MIEPEEEGATKLDAESLTQLSQEDNGPLSELLPAGQTEQDVIKIIDSFCKTKGLGDS